MAAEKTIAEKQSLKLRAYLYIKEKILSCEYAPNEFLNEQKLCEEMGNISRTPVRDALSRLEQEGLIQILPKKGTMVAGVNFADIGRIYEVRMLIEPYTLAVYGRLLDEDVLRELLEQMRDPDLDHQDNLHFSEMDDHFHAVLMEAQQNRYLRATYDNIRDINARIRVLSDRNTAARAAGTYAEHRAILEACLAKDWPAAEKAMRYHLEMGRTAAYDYAANLGAGSRL